MFPFILFLLAAALLYFAWDLRRIAAKKAQETGVRGTVLYSDADHSRPTENLTCDLPGGIKLVGKPDYLLKQEGKIVPLEYKSSRDPGAVYPNHENQVGAYFLLIEAQYGKSAVPSHGILRFADGKEYTIKNTDRLRERVLSDARQMAAIRSGAEEARRDHKSPAKCASCEFFPVCDERLA